MYLKPTGKSRRKTTSSSLPASAGAGASGRIAPGPCIRCDMPTLKEYADRGDWIGYHMHQFKHGTLHSSSGHKVTNRKQAIAIALSVQRRKDTAKHLVGWAAYPGPKRSGQDFGLLSFGRPGGHAGYGR